jgi:hypothetical protein
VSAPASSTVGHGRARASLAGMLGVALAAPGAAIAAPFWVMSSLTRQLPRRLPLQPSHMPWAELIHFEPELGCLTHANLDTHGFAEDVFQLTTDSEGWRGRLSVEEADLVVVGDSFAFGYGVDDAVGFPSHAGPLRIKGVGTVAYSLVHEVLVIERLEERLGGRPVVLMPYLGNDLHLSLRPTYRHYRMPYVRECDDGWEIRTDHVSDEPYTISAEPAELEPLARLCTPGPESDRTLSAASYLLARAREACERAGSTLTLMPMPQGAQVDRGRWGELTSLSNDPERCDPLLPERVLSERCQELGIGFLSLMGVLTGDDYFGIDVHLRASGHRKVGRLLADRFARS